MNERDALIAAILAAPASDLPRLVFADWLSENGESDRAEFIRLMCEVTANWNCENRSEKLSRVQELFDYNDWFGRRQYTEGVFIRFERPPISIWNAHLAVVRRGFLSEVHAYLDWLIGGPCAYCPRVIKCSFCNDTGYVTGKLAGILRNEPVTFVGAADKAPERGWRGSYIWYLDRDNSDVPAYLPRALFEQLDFFHDFPSQSRDVENVHYTTEDDARIALSDAILKLTKHKMAKS